ncbi:DnaD domain protein [Mechercharimyces sp. CAU 1602]|uniref:DnaD domain protein n=1 Tax=Mechercharimyces sp. CAU 1602 TaxID=2973933 RepID=UPI0021614C55|nr:DnaD domain protein [Mechercharimyces sp. CAU 1602]MCS1351587.1 DnaD domain protein [Mechercharimyces sp. CAU 1602]
MNWKECSPMDLFRVRTESPIQFSDINALLHLYQPMVGATAASLYLTLAHQPPFQQSGRSAWFPHRYLMNLTALPFIQMLEARYQLEGVGLLTTRVSQKNDRRCFEYEWIAPLSPAQFFASDVLNITLFHRLGKEQYTNLRKQMIQPLETEEQRGTWMEVTKSFQDVFGTLTPSEMQVAAEIETKAVSVPAQGVQKQKTTPTISIAEESNLNYIYSRMRPLLHEHVWTETLQEQLQQIQLLYELSEWDLLRALQNPEVTRAGHIDMERLRSFIRSEYQARSQRSAPDMSIVKDNPSPQQQQVERDEVETEEEKHFRQLESISPLEFMSYYHQGTRIPKADMELVECLMTDYRLPHGVINVLLDYVLQTHNNKLPRPLVEKIAGHWKRERVNTVTEAVELALRERHGQGRQNSDVKRVAKPRRSPITKRDKVPEAVAKGRDQQAKNEAKEEWDADPQAQAEIMEQLQRMRSRLDQRMREKRQSR